MDVSPKPTQLAATKRQHAHSSGRQEMRMSHVRHSADGEAPPSARRGLEYAEVPGARRNSEAS